MAVSIEQIRAGAVFRFKTAARRVVSIGRVIGNGFNVEWQYADGKARGGRMGGSQWVHYFRKDAIEEIPGLFDQGEKRMLLVSRREVGVAAQPVDIALNTRCPQKWGFVDMETGEVWGHDNARFVRMSAEGVAEVALVAQRRFSAGEEACLAMFRMDAAQVEAIVDRMARRILAKVDVKIGGDGKITTVSGAVQEVMFVIGEIAASGEDTLLSFICK